MAGGDWNSYGRADPIIPAELDSASLHLRPSRMRYSPQDRTLTPNYDVHDVLASVGMEEAGAALASARSDPDAGPSGGTSINGRLDRIYLTRELIGDAVGYVQREMRNSEHRALMLTVDRVAAAGAAPSEPGA